MWWTTCAVAGWVAACVAACVCFAPRTLALLFDVFEDVLFDVDDAVLLEDETFEVTLLDDDCVVDEGALLLGTLAGAAGAAAGQAPVDPP